MTHVETHYADIPNELLAAYSPGISHSSAPPVVVSHNTGIDNALIAFQDNVTRLVPILGKLGLRPFVYLGILLCLR